MDEQDRARVRAVFRRFGIDDARRATSSDPTEEVFLISPASMARAGERSLTEALMQVLPDVKVWVATESDAWTSEPI